MALAEMCVRVFDDIGAFSGSVSDEQAWSPLQILCKAVFVDDRWCGFGDLAVEDRTFASLRMTGEDRGVYFHAAGVNHRNDEFGIPGLSLCYESVKSADSK